jgi:hypothetical protein
MRFGSRTRNLLLESRLFVLQPRDSSLPGQTRHTTTKFEAAAETAAAAAHRPAFRAAFFSTATFPDGLFTNLKWKKEQKADAAAHLLNRLYALVHQVGNSLLFLLELGEDVALRAVS